MTEQRPVPGAAENADDSGARRTALDVTRSFIVQAPAGSGKTELLIQRYLALLGGVEDPEEIIAITFTRKAAAEMKRRIIDALHSARADSPPAEAHRLLTWTLARAALARDRERGWQVDDNASRLRILTIDALCASLTRQMPLLARFGAQPASTENADALYREAARNLLALIDAASGDADPVARLLLHLDNDLGRAESLIASMLRHRDQWLRRGRPDRNILETAFADARIEAMTNAARLIDADFAPEIVELAAFAAANLARAEIELPIRACADLSAFPVASEGDIPVWLGIAELLLTKAGAWRSPGGVNRNVGFPTSKDKVEKAALDAQKARMGALLDALSSDEELRTALDDLRRLPPPRYSDTQWEALGAIVHLLPRATAELWNVFAAHGECDFSEIALAALRALGTSDAPTDLALALDYRIRHLLVDEFQDTSLAQFDLLERLTAGWQRGDGRTLFLVGDPMQSIYRFREAEVGLFLRARHGGIGEVALEPLALGVNFRSQQGIVEWVNAAFARIMPAHEDVAAGAVPYAPCAAERDRVAGEAVTLHTIDDRDTEAACVLELVRAERHADPAAKIAILVRSRSHLVTIVASLKGAGLSYRAVEIEALGARQIVRDLNALACALSHPGDRTAWLAALRAPWCGLTLADLGALADDGAAFTLPELLRDAQRAARLGDDGRARLERTRAVLLDALAQRRRASLRDTVEGVWLALGGPAAVGEGDGGGEFDDAQRYLDFLGDCESAAILPGSAAFMEGLGKLYAAPDPHADETLQIMTIHKAKGLEFDCVIVPGLGRKPRGDDARLMTWIERPRAGGNGAGFLLAPIREAGVSDDAMSAYIARLDQLKGDYETVRLLYVAATRARRRLHLLGGVSAKTAQNAPVKPVARSLLAALWPVVADAFAGSETPAPVDLDEEQPIHDGRLRRLASDWSAPAPGKALEVHGARKPAAAPPAGVEFSWASQTAKHVGTVVHRYLQSIAREGADAWDRERLARIACAPELAALGVPRDELDAAQSRVRAALVAAASDERGRWLLAAKSVDGDAQSELRITGIVDGEVANFIIDRTFVDQNVRWIVDFKTGTHEGGEREAFLDNERERYRAQLERYAGLMSHLDDRPIRLGLYFPLLGGWREWDFPAAHSGAGN